MIAAVNAGMASRTSAIRNTGTITNSGWRIADSLDALQIDIVNVGDMIVDRPNITAGYVHGAIDIRPAFNSVEFPTTFALGPSKKLVIVGGQYDYIRIENPNINGLANGTKCPITNYNGQIITNSFTVVSGQYFRVTGEYSAINKTGDVEFQGHEGGYAFSSGKYGIWVRREWRDTTTFLMGVGGNTTSKDANFYEIDHVEVSDGGFSIGLKWDSPPLVDNVDTTMSFHDNYVHNIFGEGTYFGQNTNNGSHRFINTTVYNNRFIQVGNEGGQFGNFAEGCDIHHNVFAGCGLAWKSPFERFQDRAIQLSTRNGVCKFRHNHVLGCSDYFIVLANDNGLNAPPDNPVLGNDIEITFNNFMYTRNQGGYIFGVNDGITGYKINDNFFHYFADNTLPANLRYSSVYPAAVPATRVWYVGDNTVSPIEFKRNKYQAGLTFVVGASSNVTIGAGADANVAQANPLPPQFINTGRGNDFNWFNLSIWSANIGELSGFTSSGTNKGQPNIYNTGNRALYNSVEYISNVDGNTGHQPGSTSDFWWTRLLYNSGQTTNTPDDYRALSTDFFNQHAGIGLLDNETPSVGGIDVELGTFDPVFFEPEVQDNIEIQIAAFEAGLNQLRFKIDYPVNILTANSRIVGIGSSTMAGSGATSPFKVHEQLKAWVTANITGGDFFYQAVAGLDSRSFVSDGVDALSDWNRNIEATLALDPDIVIISLPSNDPGNGISNAQWLANFKDMFFKCKAANVYCFIVSPQPRTGYNIALQQQLYDMRLLMLSDVDIKDWIIDVFPLVALPYSLSQPATINPLYATAPPDGIHLNNDGATVWVNKAIETMENKFVDKGYIKYQLERSTSELTGYSLLVDNILANEIFITREDGTNYYYRVRAQRADLSYTAYSTPIQIQQPIFAGDILETVQVDFSRSANAGANPGWNEWLPSDDHPTVGEEIDTLLTMEGVDSGLSIEITGPFPAVIANSTSGSGGRAGEYPLNVIRSSWRFDATAKPMLKIKGLDPDYLYNFKVLHSNSATSDYRFSGVTIGERRQSKSANDPVTTSNDGDTNDFYSLKPSAEGEIELKLRALATIQVGWINAIQIEKLNNNNGIPIELGLFDYVAQEPVVIGGSAITGRVNINITGAVSSGLPEWNDVNAVNGVNWPDLLTDDFNNSGMGIKLTNIETSTQDNGASYGAGDLFPAAVLRYCRYRSGNPGIIIELNNLSANRLYDITLIASRLSNGNIQSFTINGVSQNLAILNNKDTEIVFLDIAADGALKITCNIAFVSGTANYTYINGLIVDIKATSAPIDIELGTFDPVFFEPEVLQPEIPIELGTFDPVFFEPSIEEDESPAEFFDDVLYLGSGTEVMGGRIPAGYYSNSNLYPAILWLCGAGETGSMASIMSHDFPKQLMDGDTLDEKYICFWPEGIDNLSSWNNLVGGKPRGLIALEYMEANFRIDPNQIKLMGYSLGGAGVMYLGLTYPNRFAAILSISGSQALTSPWVNLDDVAVWSHHGTVDGAQAPQNSIRLLYNTSNGTGMNVLSPAPKYPPVISLYWGQGHGIQVNFVLRRKSSGTPGSPRSTFDYNIDFLDLHSRDEVQAATYHVDYAELKPVFMNYVKALNLTNALPSSSEKTALLARLTALKALLWNRAFVVDFGSSTYLSSSPINNFTNINNGISITNIIDYDGNASTVGVNIPARWSTFQPQTNFNLHYDAPYWGLPKQLSRDGGRALTTISNGSGKFTGLNNSLKYKLIILHAMENGDNLAQQAAARVLCNGVTVNQYSQYNTVQFMEWDEITPVGGEIIFYPTAPQNRDWCIQAAILIEKP